ncbi:MAG: DnaJ domain-containing protein [Candidatus Solibacter usitatus]|nr:DnaJ domain-containing protein [Candidatus Solibacter usitatus]
MTYYEELGIGVKASREEIREAYLQLARVVHPDTKQDESMRAEADCQMKRLNVLYETLANPEERRRYDLALQPDRPSRESVRRMGLVWPVLSLLAFLAMVFSLRQVPTETRTLRPAVENSSPPIEKIEPKPAKRAARPAVRRGIASIKPTPQPAPPDVNVTPFLPPVSVIPEASLPPPPVEMAVAGMSGTWLYARQENGMSAGKGYAAEFIEAVISEESGALQGIYRARYRVTDQAMQPEVNFAFRGEPGAREMRVPWSGAGGSNGNLLLRLVSPNSMEIAWIANEMGTLGLASGKALLTRQQQH